MQRPQRLVALSALLAAPVAVPAGGFLSLNSSNEQPFRWNTTQPIAYNLDRGGLGIYSDNTIDDMVVAAFARWSSAQVPTASLSFTRGSDLSRDHGNGSASNSNNPQFQNSGDGVSPIIYDNTGLLIDRLFSGASRSVVGFGGVERSSGNTIQEGFVLLNGLFVNSTPGDTVLNAEMSTEQFEGVITHEIGHFLNLDHAMANDSWALGTSNSVGAATPNRDYRGYPTMHPGNHVDARNLKLDDMAWISELYPSAAHGTRTAFAGEVRAAGGSLVDGVNIVARNVADLQQVITCVTGYNNYYSGSNSPAPTGRFRLPGIVSGGNWVIDFEPVPTRYVPPSGVGTVRQPTVLEAPAEFLNDSAVESNGDSPLISTTFTAGAPGSTLDGLVLQLNNPVADLVIDEADPPGSGSITGDHAPIVIEPGRINLVRGNVDSAEGGLTALGGDPFEDWYELTPRAPMEVTRIWVRPNSGGANLSLVVAGVSGGATTLYATAIAAGAGAEEVIEFHLDTADRGRIFVGVSIVGSGATDYELRLVGAVSNRSAMVLAGTTNPEAGVLRVSGSGFLAGSGGPSATFSDPGVTVNSVTVLSGTEAEVRYTAPTAPAGPVMLQIANAGGAGGYGGRIATTLAATVPPAVLSAINAVLARQQAIPADDRNTDGAVDAADFSLTTP